jgi:hypothetical protein
MKNLVILRDYGYSTRSPMITIPTSTRFRGDQKTASSRVSNVMRYFRLTFITGPKQLLTSRISGKCAAIMMAMCTPSLLFCALLTIPAMIFQSPHQNAYFQFARVLEQDPIRWVVLLMAGTCAILSLAVPATMPEPRESDFY